MRTNARPRKLWDEDVTPRDERGGVWFTWNFGGFASRAAALLFAVEDFHLVLVVAGAGDSGVRDGLFHVREVGG